MNPTSSPTIVITPRKLTSVAEWRELWAARDLLWFLVRRDIKTRYSQSVLGLGWAVVQPLFTMGVFTLIFHKIGGIASDGPPYAVWSLAAVVPWTFFQNAVNDTGNSLGSNIGVITKVYFARLVLPLAAVAGKFFDLLIMLLMLGITLLVTIQSQAHVAHLDPANQVRVQPIALVAVPLALLVIIIAALALGLWLAGLSVQYRDVRVAQGMLLQLLLYVSPIVYPSSKVPAAWHWPYFLNPLAGGVETMRAALLGNVPVPWLELSLGGAVAVIGLLGGIWCFRRSEQIVADVA